MSLSLSYLVGPALLTAPICLASLGPKYHGSGVSMYYLVCSFSSEVMSLFLSLFLFGQPFHTCTVCLSVCLASQFVPCPLKCL